MWKPIYLDVKFMLKLIFLFFQVVSSMVRALDQVMKINKKSLDSSLDIRWCSFKIVTKIWSKIRVFGLFKKTKSSFFSEIGIKHKFLWFINILQKLHACKKSGSQFMAKTGSRPMRLQYSLIVNISLIGWYLAFIFGM